MAWWAWICSVVVWWYVGCLLLAWASGQLAIKHWLHQVVVVLDQAANVLLIPFHRGSWADETLSSRSYRSWMAGKIWGQISRPMIDFLFSWQSKTHCQDAFNTERNRLHSPPEERNV